MVKSKLYSPNINSFSIKAPEVKNTTAGGKNCSTINKELIAFSKIITSSFTSGAGNV